MNLNYNIVFIVLNINQKLYEKFVSIVKRSIFIYHSNNIFFFVIDSIIEHWIEKV